MVSHPRNMQSVQVSRFNGIMNARGRVKPYYERLTVPDGDTCNPAAKASQPTMRAISWTRVFVSRALVSLERSWDIFARRHGWPDTWTLEGTGGEEAMDM